MYAPYCCRACNTVADCGLVLAGQTACQLTLAFNRYSSPCGGPLPVQHPVPGHANQSVGEGKVMRSGCCTPSGTSLYRISRGTMGIPGESCAPLSSVMGDAAMVLLLRT